MTGSTRSSDGLDLRRRKLKFRSWHRGMREMDLIMGRFADAFVDRMAAPELDQFERLIELPDPDRPLTLAGVADGAEGLVVADLARAVAAAAEAAPTSLVVVCRDGQRLA